MLCADPVALIIFAGLTLIRFFSINLIFVSNKEGMRMNIKLFMSALLETLWATVVSATAGYVLSL
jgi:UDP:flavonoid glycosyltransferase YjiC (YdhE family)